MLQDSASFLTETSRVRCLRKIGLRMAAFKLAIYVIHERQVKCDRKEPCSNCVTAKANCLRNRHKRAPRPKPRTDDKIQSLVQRLSSLEDSVRSSQRTASALPDHNGTASPDGVPSERPRKRRRTGSPITEATSVITPTPDVDSTQQTANEARHLISKELSTNGLLSVHQRSVLETAISFVDQLSHAPVPTITDRSTFDRSMHVYKEITQGEILHVILGTETRTFDDSTIHFHALDHIPPKSVEKSALALMEGSAGEETMLLYKIIIHFKAAVVLYGNQLQGPKSPAVQKHIRQMEYDHLTAALTALDSISFLTTPSLLLVQVLITGAIMMQILGNPASCWEMIAYASRAIVALGYHNINDTEVKSELDEEIHAALAWCAQFDSCMSLLLLRPKSLPPLHVKISSLVKPDPANPMAVFEFMAMEMVPVHDKILELTLESSKKSATSLKEEVAWLRKEMTNLYSLMEQNRPSYLIDTHVDILLHWKCLEFKYFSTLTSVHRLSPSVTTHPSEREECLQSARKALECVKFIEEVGKSLGHFIEGYDPYLAWTLLSYPLCPFFVVFCNVVGTSNAQDFQLLQDVTDGISTLVTENKYVHRLHRLCATLLGLCKPLVQTTGLNGDLHAGFEAGITTYAPPSSFGTAQDVLDESKVDDSNGDLLPCSWNDDMMWQLFQSQPSLDWFNADILDPAWDVSPPK
ncbi:uncharacterized protein K460DRAFT_407404 [Cucurbitaria berberidis CBS 394.84]|uniref:Transcription factor domain-containing protein n=1 Tax=Cucurbitaria berberidis CBS 394.84 TaxID=1168544 RepID=A0A9P4GCJ0_9PLEO|nr:uncharacterized protein K460DRAFT_407404 [Cucurbitaria berberidis CBS 394.84]KAF1843031.1 hypothetical protein K460DRAFT_407404 [Cucurbitaria berberidis CBS 394.84]